MRRHNKSMFAACVLQRPLITNSVCGSRVNFARLETLAHVIKQARVVFVCPPCFDFIHVHGIGKLFGGTFGGAFIAPDQRIVFCFIRVLHIVEEGWDCEMCGVRLCLGVVVFVRCAV